jgi:hypothetical protein
MKKIFSRFTEVYQNRNERKNPIFFKEPARYFKMIVRNKKHTFITEEEN